MPQRVTKLRKRAKCWGSTRALYYPKWNIPQSRTANSTYQALTLRLKLAGFFLQLLPVSQNGSGRDHNRNAFSLLLAGGGFKGGHVHGATDEVGYRSVEGRVSVNDLHATLLHQLGLDHNELTFTHHGRPETLTDAVVTNARVVTEIIA